MKPIAIRLAGVLGRAVCAYAIAVMVTRTSAWPARAARNNPS